MKPITEIANIEDAKAFIRECVSYLGLGFHPDDDFEDYIEVNSGETLYSPEKASLANALMEEAFNQFDLANEDIYEYTLSLL